MNIKAKRVHKFNFKPFSKKQLRVLNWWADNSPVKDRRMMIADGSIRAGKSQPLTSKLYTPYGYKFMGDIKVGDYVFDRNGKQTKVLELFPQGKLDTYRITFSDGSSTECSKEHLWGVWKYSTYFHGNREFTVVETSELINLDFNSSRPKYLFPLAGCVQFNEHSVDIEPYLLGLLLGDGCLSETTSNITLTNSESDIVSYCTNLTSDCNVSSYNNSNRIRFVGDFNANLVGSLSNYGLYGTNSVNKFIPNEYKYNSIEVRSSILAGIINTDGNVHKNRPVVRYGTVSKRLFDDVVEIARSLGMYTIEDKEKVFDNDNWNTYYSCSIRLNENLIDRLSNKHKKKFTAEKKPRNYRTIKSIEYVGKFEHQCILVDNKEHLYITDDFIVTHNTLAITLSFILFVMKNYNNQNAAVAGKSVGAVRRNIIPNMLSMLLSLGYEYVEHRSDNYIEIIKGDVVNNVYLFGLVF